MTPTTIIIIEKKKVLEYNWDNEKVRPKSYMYIYIYSYTF